ncbi:cupin domain-containing protein [Marinomonas sp. THO17]|uniref:cupin domain-containing protein n=1 Tax=Marinomonas sp. THO17 TaxID=3149048 RepID=UPI00336C2012
MIKSPANPVAVPTVQLENERAIVTEWRFAPGAETTLHTHEYDYIVVPQTTGRLTIETEDGRFYSDLTTGVSYSRGKGVKHNVINENSFEFVFVEIELK